MTKRHCWSSQICSSCASRTAEALLQRTPTAIDTINPTSITLKLKNGHSTIFIHAEPSTTISELKSELLDILQDLPRDTKTLQDLQGLPTDSSRIVLAILVNNSDPKSGWVPLEIPETEVEDGPNGETKTVGGPTSILNKDLSSAGLKDCTQIAYRFLTDAEIESGEWHTDAKLWNVEHPKFEDEEEGDTMEA